MKYKIYYFNIQNNKYLCWCEYISDMKKGDLIKIQNSNDTLKSFLWRENDKYKYGQLFVSFKNSNVKYMYDVPFEVYEKMAEIENDDNPRTVFNWYDENIVDYVDKDRRYNDDVLYTNKYKP